MTLPSFESVGQLTIGIDRVKAYLLLGGDSGATSHEPTIALRVNIMGIRAYIVAAVMWAEQYVDFEMLTDAEMRARYAPARKLIVGGVEVESYGA
jgi:hypothetical protein